jgi:putative MATE family efflux protein
MDQNMTQGKVFPILIKFAVPIFIGNIFQQLYNMADTLIVGRFVGEKALAAVGSTGTIMFLIFSFSTGLTSGFTVLTSQSYGAENYKRVRHSVANAVILSAIVTIITTVFSVLSMGRLLTLMSTPADIYNYAYDYIINISFGIFCSVFYNLGASILRSVGNSKVPLYFLIFSACLNVVLDLFLIIVFNMGTAGAAIATNISQGISAILCFAYILKKEPELTPHRDDWYLSRLDTKSQLGVGIPMALQFGITASGTMIMQTAINHFGSEAIAAFTAASKVINLFTQGMPAMGQTMTSYGGQNYGSGNYDRIKQGLKASCIIMLIYSIAAALLSNILMEPTMHLFFSDASVIPSLLPWARIYVQLCSLFYIPLSAIFIYRDLMQGCGYGLLPMIGGILELAARAVTANISMVIKSYPLAAFSDPAAWIATGVYSIIVWHFLFKKIQSGHR